MVGQQLQGNGGWNRSNARRTFWNHDDIVESIGHPFIPFAYDGNHRGIARLALLGIAQGLVLAGNIVQQRDDRRVFPQQGNGTMFQFGGVVSLSMNITDFLELQRPFQRHGIEVATPDKERVLVVGILLRDRLYLIVLRKHLFNEFWKTFYPFAHLLAFIERHAARTRDLKRHHQHHRNLAGEGLGGGHADLGSGMQIDASTGFACNRRAHHVADTGDHGPLVLGLAHGRQSIGRLARLANGHYEVGRRNNRVAVAEFRGLLHFGQDAGHLLDGVFPYHAGVHGCAATHHENPVDHGGVARRKIKSRKHGGSHSEVKPAANRIPDRTRLFEHFLEHKVGIFALFG